MLPANPLPDDDDDDADADDADDMPGEGPAAAAAAAHTRADGTVETSEQHTNTITAVTIIPFGVGAHT